MSTGYIGPSWPLHMNVVELNLPLLQHVTLSWCSIEITGTNTTCVFSDILCLRVARTSWYFYAGMMGVLVKLPFQGSLLEGTAQGNQWLNDTPLWLLFIDVERFWPAKNGRFKLWSFWQGPYGTPGNMPTEILLWPSPTNPFVIFVQKNMIVSSRKGSVTRSCFLHPLCSWYNHVSWSSISWLNGMYEALWISG